MPHQKLSDQQKAHKKFIRAALKPYGLWDSIIMNISESAQEFDYLYSKDIDSIVRIFIAKRL